VHEPVKMTFLQQERAMNRQIGRRKSGAGWERAERPAVAPSILLLGVLLLPVMSPCAGRIIAHLVESGSLVGYGARLVALRPMSSEVTT
jgi:hypothetical protein